MPRHDHFEHLFARRFEAAGLQGIVAGRQGLVAIAVIVEERDDRVEVVRNVCQQPPMDFGRGILLFPLDIVLGQRMVGCRKIGRQANRLVEALDRLRPAPNASLKAGLSVLVVRAGLFLAGPPAFVAVALIRRLRRPKAAQVVPRPWPAPGSARRVSSRAWRPDLPGSRARNSRPFQ